MKASGNFLEHPRPDYVPKYVTSIPSHGMRRSARDLGAADIHPDQDEYLYILEGQFDSFLDGAETQATPGDLVGCRWASRTASQQVRPHREDAVLGIADAALYDLFGRSTT